MNQKDDLAREKRLEYALILVKFTQDPSNHRLGEKLKKMEEELGVSREKLTKLALSEVLKDGNLMG